jgi:dipeptidyl aminopeptidase/acylaminoacyl peptidase
MKYFTRALAAILAVSLLGHGGGVRAAAPQPLALEDLRASVSISDPQFGGCGKNLAFVTRSANFATDTYVTIVRTLDVRTGTIATVTRPSDGASSPRWSPDGTQLAFLAKPKKADAPPVTTPPTDAPPPKPGATSRPQEDDDAYDAPQIAVVSARSLAPVFVTHEKRGVDTFAWKPDGSGFVFITADEAPNKKALDAHDDGFDVGDNQWTLKAEPVASNVWSIAASGGTAHRITSGTATFEGEPHVTKDGTGVLVDRYPDAFTQHYAARRLVRVDVRTGAVTPVVAKAPADGKLSRDGKRLAYLSQNPASFSIDDVFESTPAGASPIDETRALDRGASDVAFDADDRSLVVSVHDGTHARLVRVGHGKPQPIDLRAKNVGVFDVDCHGSIALTAASPTEPTELYLAAPGKPLRRLTHYNTALAHHALGRVETVRWKTRDGVMADGVVTVPPTVARGTRAPLVLVIHGGPTSSSLQTFSGLSQLLAARGFYVFEPNYRGSDNLGAAFAQQTVPHITSVPGNDIEDGLAAVLRQYPIDPARIGVSGWSEGGLLTSWLITHDTRWKAAMSGAAVNDWLMYRDLTDAQDFTRFFIGEKSPWTDERMREFYRFESPLTYAANVKTPTLIMTDAGDQRVPTPLSYAFYHAIRATGTPVTMIVIPADGHFPGDPVRIEEVYRHWIDWFTDKL